MAKPGIPFEEQIREELDIDKTSLSGGAHDDADGRAPGRRFLCECKDESGDAIRFPYSDLVKIKRQAMKHSQGDWIRCFRNGRGDVVVSMNYELFQQLYEIAKESDW